MNWHLLSFNTFILSCANKIEKWRRGRKLREKTILSLLLCCARVERRDRKRSVFFFICQSFLIQPEEWKKKKTNTQLLFYIFSGWMRINMSKKLFGLLFIHSPYCCLFFFFFNFRSYFRPFFLTFLPASYSFNLGFSLGRVCC